MKLANITPVVLLTLLGAGCTAPQQATEGEGGAALTSADEAAIGALVDEFGRNVVAAGFAANAELLTDDYIEMRPVAVEGKEAARQAWGAITNTYTESTSRIQRIEGSGALAFAWVEFTNRYVNDEGVPRVQNGNTLWVLRRGPDGQWRFAGAGWQSSTQNDSVG